MIPTVISWIPPSSSTTSRTVAIPGTNSPAIRKPIATGIARKAIEREDEAEHRRRLQRHVRERRDRVEAEADHLPRRVLRLARETRIAVVLDRLLAIADPARHPADEAVALAHRVERVERVAIEQPEVAGVGLDRDLRQARDEPVEPARGEQLEPASRPRARGARRRRCPPRRASARASSRITSGGSWRSASIITVASPRARSRPAVIAAWWPKLRERVTTRTRSSAAAISRSSRGVSSVLPSSTITSSNGSPSSAAMTRRWNSTISSCSLQAGATTLSSVSSRPPLSVSPLTRREPTWTSSGWSNVNSRGVIRVRENRIRPSGSRHVSDRCSRR